MAERPITKPMDRDVNTYRFQSLPLFDMLDRERGTMSNAQAPSGTQSFAFFPVVVGVGVCVRFGRNFSWGTGGQARGNL